MHISQIYDNVYELQILCLIIIFKSFDAKRQELSAFLG